MKKIFTLATAILASFSLWAADIKWVAPQEKTAIDYYQTMDDGKSLFAGKAKTGSNVTPEEKEGRWCIKSTNSGGFWLIPASDITKITVPYLCSSTNSANIKFKIQTTNFGTDVNSAAEVEFKVKNNDGKNVWHEAEMSIEVKKDECIYVKFPTNVYISQVILSAAPACNKPEKELVLKADKEAPIYVGDEVTFSTEGGNSNTPVIAGDAGEEINAGKWIATEGKHTFTATQEAEGEICAQVAVLELTVLTKNPVTAVTIAGEKEGFIGEPYTYTATAANATDYAWYVDGVSANTNAAEFTYTPNAAGAYSIVCKARNEYNATDEWIASDPIELKVTKKVVVMEDTYIWKKGSGYTGCVENPNVDPNANQAETELANSKAAFSGMSKMGRASADDTEISLTFTAKEGLYIKSICTYGKLEEPEGAQISWDGKNWENLAAYSEGEKSFEAPAETFPETFTIKFLGVSKDSGGLWWRNALVTLGEKESATAIENTEAGVKAVKVIRDGQLYIMHNGRMYNVQGAVVK